MKQRIGSDYARHHGFRDLGSFVGREERNRNPNRGQTMECNDAWPCGVCRCELRAAAALKISSKSVE